MITVDFYHTTVSRYRCRYRCLFPLPFTVTVVVFARTVTVVVFSRTVTVYLCGPYGYRCRLPFTVTVVVISRTVVVYRCGPCGYRCCSPLCTVVTGYHYGLSLCYHYRYRCGRWTCPRARAASSG